MPGGGGDETLLAYSLFSMPFSHVGHEEEHRGYHNGDDANDGKRNRATVHECNEKKASDDIGNERDIVIYFEMPIKTCHDSLRPCQQCLQCGRIGAVHVLVGGVSNRFSCRQCPSFVHCDGCFPPPVRKARKGNAYDEIHHGSQCNHDDGNDGNGYRAMTRKHEGDGRNRCDGKCHHACVRRVFSNPQRVASQP